MMKTSAKWKLVSEDLLSWMTTVVLMLAPIVIGEAIVAVQGMTLGHWGSAILLVLGSLLKLAQKWSQLNNYPQ